MSIVNSNYVPNKEDSSDDEGTPVQRLKKRVQRFSESESEKETVQSDDKTVQADNSQNNSDTESKSGYIPPKSVVTKSSKQMNGSSSDSDDSMRHKSVKNGEQQIRMKNKRNKLKDKFKGLLSSRGKNTSPQNSSDEQSSQERLNKVSETSDSEMSSIARIKMKIKKSMVSVCDLDTSDDEEQLNKKRTLQQKQRKVRKSTKLTEPKPIRMSAKQALENMQLIKSESNRMLREKTVSLPYHRPKALSLKDIMARRKPAVSADGKALPIKMNTEQLIQYSILLEQRQKEMMELCKSESDEETLETEENLQKTCQETHQFSDSNNIECDTITEKLAIKCIENETIDINVNASNDVELTELVQNETTNSENGNNDKEIEKSYIDSTNLTEEYDQKDSNTDLKIVYNNDFLEEENFSTNNKSILEKNEIQNEHRESNECLENNSEQQVYKVNSEPESQLISLHYRENNTEQLETTKKSNDASNENCEKMDTAEENKQDDFFSDDDVNMDDIDRIIQNAEIMKDDEINNSPMIIRDPQASNVKPKLIGTPGMVIDFDGGASMQKKLSGIELLKERFIYFSKLKAPDELEREREKKFKPGAQHLKLKQELEDKIAEQRSIEWARRLEEEKQQHVEMETILDDAEDSFEKIEEKLEECDEKEENCSSDSEEEELEENDIEIKDKPRNNNPMVDDEAEESDCDENNIETELTNCGPNEDIDDGGGNVDQDDEEETSDDESSDSEEEQNQAFKPKKGRILKAFEDSDDEVSNETVAKESNENVANDNNTIAVNDNNTIAVNDSNTIAADGNKPVAANDSNETNDVDKVINSNAIQGSTQDDVIQLAQRYKSASDDLFTSQESSTLIERSKDRHSASEEVFGTQTFSILDSTSGYNLDMELKTSSQSNELCMTQLYHNVDLNGIVDGSQLPVTQSSQSQPIGEDILALCTGKFYDSEFVSQTEENQQVDNMSQDSIINNCIDNNNDKSRESENENDNNITDVDNMKLYENSIKLVKHGKLVNSIIDELEDEFDEPKKNKFFTGSSTRKEEKYQVPESCQMKKKLIIDSDDETTAINLGPIQRKKKNVKKKKLERRALHISDDEEEAEQLEQEDDEYVSDLEDSERIIEYDSEENEIEVKPDVPKKKRKVADFFEQEAELTSEDEWVGSGDEDEKGLDRMEREAGDDEVFHQGKLRRELGQIHMRDVLDQDKREVRLIQELLFEDGDLGDGHRQRKFRWRTEGENDETGTVDNEFADTQEEEFESEEQWRKQRHEREVFLKQMQQDEEEGSSNVSVNRNTIIKANLSSKSMSTLLQEVNQSKTEKTESPVVQEKNTAKDIPSPKKSFSIFQQNYHGSLLTRGRGALARLAALATPLAVDDDAPKIGSLAAHQGNFVFTALTPEVIEPKVTIKRKAAVSLGTPKLVKKIKIEEKMTRPKSSLLDHFNL